MEGSPFSRTVGEIHQQDRVLLDDPHEQDQADNTINVNGPVCDKQGHERARYAERERHQHRDRVDKAVEL